MRATARGCRSLAIVLWSTVPLSSCATEPCIWDARFLYAEAALTPENVVPLVEDTAEAWAAMNLRDAESGNAGYVQVWVLAADRFNYGSAPPTIDVSIVEAVHIHEGAAGENGPVHLTLGEYFLEDEYHIAYVDRPRSAADAAQLFDLVLAGRAYVDVHTTEFPDGHLRGDFHVAGLSDRRCVEPD